MTGVLVTTGSRAGLLAAGAGLLSAFVLALLARVRLPWPRLAILLIAALVLAFAFRGSILGRLGQNIDRRTGVDVYRAWTWKGTFAMARANPLFGTGPGTFEARYGRYARIAPTTHAHSSYLQVAAEQGFPALAAAVAALALALVSGLRGLRPLPPGGTTDAEQERRFVFCALFGGLVAGVIRAAFDSEWWVLGNGIPFWTVAGLVAGGAVRPAKAQTGDSATAKRLFWPARVAALAAIAGTCALSLMLFFHAVALQGARIAVQEDPATALPRAQIVAQTWPPDPEALALFGSLLDPARALPLYEQAARIEPSGSRLFPLAGVYGVLGRSREALQTLEQARNAQPTVLQNLRALAEAYERQNSHDRALATWNELARLQEGPVGQVIGTAIFPETEAAWAYAALAREALVRGNIQAAADLYGKSAAQIEDYSATSPEGQLAELVMAQSSGEDVSKKRREIRALYEQVMDAQIALETKRRNPVQVQRLEKRKAETLARLASFATDKDLATGQ
jgi:tetratricopeptide (TPR) repeat protein